MIRLKNIWITLTMVLALIVLIAYSFSFQATRQPIYTYKKYCSNCHLLPNPQEYPKHFWRDNILPEMAARLGLSFNPQARKKRTLSMEEQLEIDLAGIYPGTPQITQKEWDLLYNYIMQNSPDSLIVTNYAGRSKPLQLFKVKTSNIDEKNGALVTFLKYQTDIQKLFIGNAFGEIYHWKDAAKGFELLDIVRSPVTYYKETASQKYLMEIGIMPSSELANGIIWENEEKGKSVIVEQLRRPVFAEWLDLNKDGISEIIVAQFGNEMGELIMLRKNHQGKFEKSVLLSLPGIIKVIAKDMNQDGWQDLIVLASQAREGIYILYNSGNFKFSTKSILQFKPNFGICWFELLDFDKDGDLDIVLVNGDNVDNMILKPYHGLRIYLNDGKNQFKESFFYPIYGATRVIAKDFDQDQDIDLAITAYFPDFERNSKESFLYLENINTKKFQFKPQTFEEADHGRWMVMESGDFDQDGDEDIVLGSFDAVSGSGKFREKWQKNNVDLMWLENKLKSKVIQ
jgi:hypothetical protein